jgi:hypothetical protein
VARSSRGVAGRSRLSRSGCCSNHLQSSAASTRHASLSIAVSARTTFAVWLGGELRDPWLELRAQTSRCNQCARLSSAGRLRWTVGLMRHSPQEERKGEAFGLNHTKTPHRSSFGTRLLLARCWMQLRPKRAERAPWPRDGQTNSPCAICGRQSPTNGARQERVAVTSESRCCTTRVAHGQPRHLATLSKSHSPSTTSLVEQWCQPMFS